MKPDESTGPFWRSRTGLALLGFFAIAGFFLVNEHRAHLFGTLPFLLLALCPLLHLFGHGPHGHGGHSHGDGQGPPGTRTTTPGERHEA